jgi:hypothetical protein
MSLILVDGRAGCRRATTCGGANALRVCHDAFVGRFVSSLRDSVGIFVEAFPTLKGGANMCCAYGAGFMMA